MSSSLPPVAIGDRVAIVGPIPGRGSPAWKPFLGAAATVKEIYGPPDYPDATYPYFVLTDAGVWLRLERAEFAPLGEGEVQP